MNLQSIDEANFLTINNTNLFTLIRGENTNNPILLILHGGSSQSANFAWFNKELEKDFIVVYFDQRGEGKSTLEDYNSSDLNLEDFIEDIHQLTLYLKNRFSQEKIYLLGHSMGTLLGIKTVKKYPKNYISYIAVAQTANAVKNDNLAYEILKNNPDVNQKHLQSIPQVTKENIYSFNIKRRTKELLALSLKHQGMLYNSSLFNMFKTLLLPIFLFKHYRFKDKKRALTQNKERLLFFYENTPMDSINKVDIPIYFIHGKEDLVINYNLTKEYYEKLQAPYKKFITFEKSAHFPQFEESKKFNTLIYSLLKTK